MEVLTKEVKPATEKEFQQFHQIFNDENGWVKSYSNDTNTLWVGNVQGCDVIRMRLHTNLFKDITAETLFNVIEDPEYSKEWDTHMIEHHLSRKVWRP